MGIRGGRASRSRSIGRACRLANRLGDEGSGFRTAMKVLDNSRLDVAATSLGIAEAALAAVLDWASSASRRRAARGKQGIQWMLADMKTAARSGLGPDDAGPGAACGRRAVHAAVGVDGQALCHGDGRPSSPTARCRSTAATASRARCRSSASCATPHPADLRGLVGDSAHHHRPFAICVTGLRPMRDEVRNTLTSHHPFHSSSLPLRRRAWNMKPRHSRPMRR